MRITAVVAGETVELSFEVIDNRISATIGDRNYSVEVSNVAEGVYWFSWNQQSIEVTVLPEGDLYSVTIGKHQLPVEVLDSHKKFQRSAHKGPSGAAEIRAPMPGRIVRVLTSPGQDVSANQGIVVIEAMKMQNEIKSPTNGKIRKLEVAEGETVRAGHLIAIVE
jgi:biotin carboxyl carrier protein